eukprot:6209992-Pleurochrysis_carterae.AAC.1
MRQLSCRARRPSALPLTTFEMSAEAEAASAISFVSTSSHRLRGEASATFGCERRNIRPKSYISTCCAAL